jgi:hypothetical protein
MPSLSAPPKPASSSHASPRSVSPNPGAETLDFALPAPPAPGRAIEVAPGILWARMALPFLLDHVNLYFIDDGGGYGR